MCEEYSFTLLAPAWRRGTTTLIFREGNWGPGRCRHLSQGHWASRWQSGDGRSRSATLHTCVQVSKVLFCSLSCSSVMELNIEAQIPLEEEDPEVWGAWGLGEVTRWAAVGWVDRLRCVPAQHCTCQDDGDTPWRRPSCQGRDANHWHLALDALCL